MARHRRDSDSDSDSSIPIEAPRRLEKPKEEIIDDVRTGGKKIATYGRTISQGKRVLRERDAFDKLGYTWPRWRRWEILSVIFFCQVSMNFNASVYPSGLSLISEHFGVSLPKARVSQLLFMVCYAIGCELWAPWSEDYGRWPIMQLSLFFVNIWQILGALAPNYGAVCVARALGGLSNAGGSVTLGITADMWESNRQGLAVAFVVLSSVLGGTVGPIFGGLMTEQLSWRWNFWIQLIVGGTAQLVHFFGVPETRSSILLDREAKRRRKSGEDENVYGPGEVSDGFNFREACEIWARPFVMFAREPIVLFLSLLSGFSDALIFTFMESFTPVYSGQWGFSTTMSGVIFVSVAIAYFIGYAFHAIDFLRQRHVIQKYGDDSRSAERRLLLLLFLAPLEPIGLFGFAWTSYGPRHNPSIPWIAPTLFVALIGIANFSIYAATIDYMVAAYGVYGSSACGGNGFSRDLLSGIAVMYADPLYQNLGEHSLEWASTLLGFIAVLAVIPIYIFYAYGPRIRAASKFASALAANKAIRYDERPSVTEDEEKQIEEVIAHPDKYFHKGK